MSSRNYLADVLFNSGDVGYVLGHVDFDAALTFTSMAATVVWTDTNCPWKLVSQEAFSAVVDYTVHTGTTAVWYALDDHYHGAPHAMARKMLLEFVEELIEKVGVPVTLGENQLGGGLMEAVLDRSTDTPYDIDRWEGRFRGRSLTSLVRS
jgi:hypothetical protein